MAEDEHEEHEHEDIHFERSEVDAVTLAALAEVNVPLRDILALTQRWADATPEERQAAPEMQRAVAHFPAWTPGYHSAGYLGASCGHPVKPLFR